MVSSRLILFFSFAIPLGYSQQIDWITQIKNRPLVDVRTYGCKGNGTLDNATCVQNAINALGTSGGTVYFPKGNFVINSKINLKQNIRIECAVVGTSSSTGTYLDFSGMSTPSNFAFEFLSTVQGSPYDIVTGITFDNCTIKAKNFLRLNQQNFPTYQASLLGLNINNVFVTGIYDTISDSNKNSATVPLHAEMAGYGIGILCNQCFRTTIKGSQIEKFGIGVEYNGDELILEDNRIGQNGWQFYCDGSIATSMYHGNQINIRNNKFGGNLRIGALTLKDVWGTFISGNYFEGYCPSAQFVRSTASIGIKFFNNKIDDPVNPGFCSGITNTTPFIYADDYYGGEYYSNFMLVGATTPTSFSFNNTYWNSNTSNQYYVHDNDSNFPIPTGYYTAFYGLGPLKYAAQPATLVAKVNPYLYSVNNMASGVTSGFANFPWELNGTINRYVTKSLGCCWGTYMYLKNSQYSTFNLNVTALKAGTGLVFVQATYVGTGTTAVYSNNLTFTDAAEVTTQTISISIPGGEARNGYWLIQWADNSEAKVETIELVPVS